MMFHILLFSFTKREKDFLEMCPFYGTFHVQNCSTWLMITTIIMPQHSTV